MLSVNIFCCFTECHFDECRYAECRYVHCRQAECRGAVYLWLQLRPAISDREGVTQTMRWFEQKLTLSGRMVYEIASWVREREREEKE